MDRRLVQSKLVQRHADSARKGRHTATDPESPENSGREMRSLEGELASLERMPQPPSLENFASILLKGRKKKNLAYALRLHAYMCKCGLEAHISLGNYLVPMFVDVGSMCDAQHVFDRLVNRNTYSWTSLITGYIECGETQHSLILYKEMQEDSVQPSGYTFVALLKACATLKDVEKGHEIHAEIARHGLARDLFVGSTLVDMYAKCGSLENAREVFDGLPIRDAISWNALIAAYVKHGLGQEALHCFEQMKKEDISPDAVTFVYSLKACGTIGATIKGQEIHAEIVKRGLERDLAVGSTLVDMYAKCGLLAKAQEAFDKLPVRDIVSWNALIAGYTKRGLGEEALKYFKQMQVEGVSPVTLTFVCCLKACGSIGATDKGLEIAAEIERQGLDSDIVVGSTLVDMYSKCGLLAKAQEIFDQLPVRDAVLWNSLIAAYANHGLGQDTLNCFEQMQVEGVSPSAVTFVCSLKACSIIGDIDKGQHLHAEIVREGLLERDVALGNALVDMYAKCGLVAKAREVFDKLQVRDVVSWTALIAGYAEHGFAEEGLNCFEQMKLEGISPDAMTFVCSLKACGIIGATDKGREIHGEVAKRGLLERDPFVASTLVDMYAKCGLLAKALEVFNHLPVRNEVSWNALMAGYAHLGESENVFQMVDTMRREGIMPNRVTFLSVLTVCNHTGLVEKGQTYFEAMSKDYGITPTLRHHTCMVDLLGRAGQLEEAIVMMKKMPYNPNLVVWHSMLGACQKGSNVELGRKAFENALRLDEKDAEAYVLMSNIYVDAQM